MSRRFTRRLSANRIRSRIPRLRELLTPEAWGRRMELVALATDPSILALASRVGLKRGNLRSHGEWYPMGPATRRLLAPSGCPYHIFTAESEGTLVRWLRANFPGRFPSLSDSPS